MRVAVSYMFKDPLTTGQFADAMDRATTEASREIAELAVQRVRDQLDSVLRHPTGFYRSRITEHPSGAEAWTVSDSKVVYGPWLEGVSRRNRRSRFKGYRTFRVVKQRLPVEAARVTERIVRERLRSM